VQEYRIINTFKALVKGRISVGSSTIVYQISILLFLFILKATLSDSDFGAFLVAIGIAAIIGAIASLRSEVLITQSDKNISRRTLLYPFLISLGVIITIWFLKPLLSFILSVPIDIYTIVLSFGFAQQIIYQFILIQEENFALLLIIRISQATLLAITATALLFGVSFDTGKWGFAIGLISPFAIWAMYWLFKKQNIPHKSFQITPNLIKRSSVLTITMLINSAAVNLPIILCVATQIPSYSADFGFMMKVFVAPVTLVNAMFGQLFLADNIKRDASIPEEAVNIRKNMKQTTIKATSFVFLISIMTILAIFIASYIFPELLGHPKLAFAIAIAVIAQAAFSPVSMIGDIAKLENPFLLFYIARIVLLYVGLSAIINIDFSLRFAMINIIVYSTFWLFADWRLKKLANPQ